MSEKNVDLYRQGIDAFNRRDLDAFLTHFDPEAIAVSRLLKVEGGSYRGHDGLRDWWRTLLDVFPDFTIEIVSVREKGDVLVAELSNHGHGGGSKTPFEESMWQVSEWRGRKVLRWQMYGSEAEALDAAGLSE